MGKTAFQVSDDPICPNVMPTAVKCQQMYSGLTLNQYGVASP
ncbi:hypothetical protein [Neisseria sicca]|nr:hypothetical protein [Neisseria sicca]